MTKTIVDRRQQRNVKSAVRELVRLRTSARNEAVARNCCCRCCR